MWISCYLYCHFFGVDAFIGHNFWYLFFEILWQKSRHWDVAIFLHSSNFCAMVLQCVYCILLFLCVHLLPHFYDNLVKRCHSLILYKDTKRLYKVMSRDYYSNHTKLIYYMIIFFWKIYIFFKSCSSICPGLVKLINFIVITFISSCSFTSQGRLSAIT